MPLTSDSWSSNCCRVICFLASLSFSTSRTAARPLATCAWLVSLNRTATPCMAVMAAMPAPMKPVPSTPIFWIFFGAGASPLTPESFLSDVVA